MRVFCVSREGVRNQVIPKIEVGDEFTVADEVDNEGRRCYIFAEIGPIVFNGQERQPAYMSKNFATLPSESDEQAIEAEQEAIIYQR